MSKNYIPASESPVSTSFNRKRGRPRISRPTIDYGTPEQAMKRVMGLTAEALDLCLERGIITSEQHWCGIHLRWLYTLRHGAPGVRAIDPTHLGGLENKTDDPSWKEARENEYHEAMKKLHYARKAADVLSICVYNERPKFLSMHAPVTERRAKEISDAIFGLNTGLDILVKLWK